MDNNQDKNQNQSSQYISMVNYLISQLNKAKISPLSQKNQSKVLPIFLYEFFVFELYLPRELLKLIKQPILSLRFLDFPTLSLEGNLNIQRQSIIFNQGKSSFFEMDLNDLKDSLLNQPMYIMFLDLNHGNINIIGNCRLNISLFAYDSFLNYGNGPIPEPRRNILQLFDNTMEKIGEFEISLLIRREYYKFDKHIEVIENTKSTLIKKAKKQKKVKLSKYKNENFEIKAEEKSKEQKDFIYDNNLEINSKYSKPQYVNNFMLEKDSAFNAHPVNKVITIKPDIKQEKYSPIKINKGDKNKKKEVMKCDANIETDPIPGIDAPINKIDYNKKIVKKKKKKKKLYNNYMNNMNIYNQNNPIMSNTLYNKYNIPENRNNNYNNNYNNNNNNYNYNNYSNSPNFNNNQYYNNQNNINPNINTGLYSNQNNQVNYNKNQNNFEYNKGKGEYNNYLEFLTNLKTQVNNYNNNLMNDQKYLQNMKEKRNLNQQNIQNININNNKFDNNDSQNNNNIINNQNKSVSSLKVSEKSENENKTNKINASISEKNNVSQNEIMKRNEENKNIEVREVIEENNKSEERKNSEDSGEIEEYNDFNINIKNPRSEEENEENYDDFENNINSNENLNSQSRNQNNNFNNREENLEGINNRRDSENSNNIIEESGIRKNSRKSSNNRNNEDAFNNKFTNFNIEQNEKREGEINENIYDNNIERGNENNNNNNIASESNIKEDTSLMRRDRENENQIGSGEIKEEISENQEVSKNLNKISRKNTSSENRRLVSSNTEEIEEILNN